MSGLLTALLLLACTLQCIYAAPSNELEKIEQEIEQLLGKREEEPAQAEITRMVKDLNKRENVDKVNHKLDEITARAVERLEAEQRGADSITLYEHIYYAGQSFTISNDMSFVGYAWNDKASSLKISGCSKWGVYFHDKYNGKMMCISANVANLVPFAFNDVISSVKKGC